VASFKVVDSLLIDIESESLEFLAEFDRERQADIAKANDADDGFFILDFFENCHSK